MTKRRTTEREHGTRAKYVADKCHCGACRRANSDYQNTLDEKRRHGRTSLVDASDSRRYINRLVELGLGDRRIAELAGTTRNVVRDIRLGSVKRIKPDTQRGILSISVDPEISAADNALIDATRTWLRIHGLMALGWTKTRIAGEAGLGRTIQLSRRHVSAKNARRIKELAEGAGVWAGGAPRRPSALPAPPQSRADTQLDELQRWLRETTKASTESVKKTLTTRPIKWIERLQIRPREATDIARQLEAIGLRTSLLTLAPELDLVFGSLSEGSGRRITPWQHGERGKALIESCKCIGCVASVTATSKKLASRKRRAEPTVAADVSLDIIGRMLEVRRSMQHIADQAHLSQELVRDIRHGKLRQIGFSVETALLNVYRQSMSDPLFAEHEARNAARAEIARDQAHKRALEAANQRAADHERLRAERAVVRAERERQQAERVAARAEVLERKTALALEKADRQASSTEAAREHVLMLVSVHDLTLKAIARRSGQPLNYINKLAAGKIDHMSAAREAMILGVDPDRELFYSTTKGILTAPERHAMLQQIADYKAAGATPDDVVAFVRQTLEPIRKERAGNASPAPKSERSEGLPGFMRPPTPAGGVVVHKLMQHLSSLKRCSDPDQTLALP